MGDVITQSKIWKFVGCVSAVTGLVCFPISSSYDKSFGKLGKRGHLFYLLVCLIVWILIVHFKRIRVSERVRRVVAVLSFVVICVISVLHDKLLPGKSDAWSIISYGSFALMSLAVSRKLELGFETGFSAFFLQLFAIQLYKIKWFLLPLALFFCSLIIILRYYSASGSGAQSGSSSPTSVAPLNESRIQMSRVINEESQDSLEQSLLHTSNQENNQEASYEAAPHPPSNNGGVSEESILEVFVDDQQNSDQEETNPSFPSTRRHSPSNYGQVSEETRSAFPASQYSSKQSLLPNSNQQTDDQEETRLSFQAESSYSSEVSSANPPQQLRRRRRMTRAIQNISSSVGDTLRRWHPPRPFSFFLFFFFKSLSTAEGCFKHLCFLTGTLRGHIA